MAETPRPAPTTGADDELLPDPPAGAPPGGLDGYKAGRPMRIVLVVLMSAAIGGTVWLVRRWQAERRAEESRPTLPEYDLSADVDDGSRPRQLVWSTGEARLGLSRAQPGVEEIVLPDRRIRLAPGHDIAQIKVDVQDGKTVSVKTLVGKVIHLPPAEDPPVDPGSPADPPATAQ
jgi:hypothetical protein